MSTAQTAVPTAKSAYIAKLSVKGIGCVPIGRKEATRLCIVLGKANGIKEGEMKAKDGEILGKWSALTGIFQAKNLETGEVFRSGKLFLPGGIHEVVEAKVKALGESGGTVEFAFELRSIESSSPAGYKYQAVPLIEPQESEDELGALVAMTEGRKMLEAPVTTVAEAPTGKKK